MTDQSWVCWTPRCKLFTVHRFRVVLVLLVWLGLVSCTAATLPHHLDLAGGYEFDTPLGWAEVTVQEASPGVVEVWRDGSDLTANLSLIINPVPEDAIQNITELGTATEVGYRFFQERQAQLQASQPEVVLEFLGATGFGDLLHAGI
ncbi:MAG: photosystem II reaction center PsbP [Spirulinaceae cyanobacterium]